MIAQSKQWRKTKAKPKQKTQKRAAKREEKASATKQIFWALWVGGDGYPNQAQK